MPRHALANLNVLELGSFIAAPFCGKLMADLGAAVLKVELPQGDVSRDFGPFPLDKPDPETSGLHLYLNANKEGVELDYRTPTGRKLLYALLRDVDVFLCDLQPRELAAWGLAYSSLAKELPGLIMTSVTPFGLTGPYRDFLSSDLLSWQATGISDRHLGLPGQEPLRAAWYLSDHWAGIHAAGATLAACAARSRTGLGQQVDISASDVIAMMIIGYQPLTTYFATGETQKRTGYVSPYAAPCALLPCKDGWVYLAALNLKQWNGLRKSMDEPEWADNELFNIESPMERMQYGEEIYLFLEPWLLQKTKEELFDLCQRNGTPVTPAYTMADLSRNAHLAARGFFSEADTPAGRLKMPGAPFKMSATPWSMRKTASKLGEDNELVFCGRLGLTHWELAGLMRARII